MESISFRFLFSCSMLYINRLGYDKKVVFNYDIHGSELSTDLSTFQQVRELFLKQRMSFIHRINPLFHRFIDKKRGLSTKKEKYPQGGC